MDKITLEMDRRTAMILALCCYAAHSFRGDMKSAEIKGLFKEKVDRPFYEFDEKDADFLANVGGRLQELLYQKAEIKIENDEFADNEELFEELFANYTNN